MKFKTIIVATKDVMTRVAVDSSTFRVMFGSVVDDVENLESITIYPESEVERRVKERVDQIDAARKAVDIACKKYCEDDVVSMIDCENYRRGKPCKWVEDLQKANAELKFINSDLIERLKNSYYSEPKPQADPDVSDIDGILKMHNERLNTINNTLYVINLKIKALENGLKEEK